MKFFSVSSTALLVGILGAVGMSTHASAQELIVNGGFEQTTLTTSGEITSTNVTGWSSNFVWNVLYPAGTADDYGHGGTNGAWLWGPKIGVDNGLTNTSPAGGNFIAADADPAFLSYDRQITQTVNGLNPGETYDLSFYSAAAQYTTASGPTTDWWNVSLGNETQRTPTLVNTSKGFTGWTLDKMTFTATNSSEVLSFLSGGSPSGYPPVSLLDGVSLTPAVPEPATAALMALGLSAVAIGARRRRRV